MSPVKRMKNRLSLKQAVESLNEKKKRSNSSTVNQDESYQKAKMFSSLISSQEFLVPEESKRNFHFQTKMNSTMMSKGIVEHETSASMSKNMI